MNILQKLSFFLVLLLILSNSFASSVVSRRVIMERWFSGSEKVLSQIKDPEVRAMIHFLKTNAVPGEPHESGVISLESGNTREWFSFVPMVPGDENLHQKWSEFFREPLGVQFSLGMRTMIVNDSTTLSEVGRTLALMHEGFHVHYFVSGPSGMDQSEAEICREEMLASTFQQKVMTLLGGLEYKELLDQEVIRITKLQLDGRGLFILPPAPYQPALGQVFGVETISVVEQEMFQESFWRHALFTALDSFVPAGEREKQKLFFLCPELKDLVVI